MFTIRNVTQQNSTTGYDLSHFETNFKISLSYSYLQYKYNKILTLTIS